MNSSYQQAGVDIDTKMRALRRSRAKIQATLTPGFLGRLGSFGSLFKSPGADHLLVSSVDGVGTKTKVARMAGRHDAIGADLVNHCVNDILVQGAEPLFFMDYFAASRIDGAVFAAVLAGLCRACRQAGCALIGGETAEMPGVYAAGEYDLVGMIVGAVPRRRLIDGSAIRAGDAILGLPSSGLHTNGYSLARRVLFDTAGLKIHGRFPGARKSVAQVLLAPHRSYLRAIRALRRRVDIRGLAHITGGGLVDNIPRVLPRGLRAVIDRAAWPIPPVFAFIQRAGRVDRDEMYRVFNMGIGMVAMVRARDVEPAVRALRAAGERPRLIGRIEPGKTEVRFLH
jgi:phosphoribosylformylglycinamidine cyclo-ligase